MSQILPNYERKTQKKLYSVPKKVRNENDEIKLVQINIRIVKLNSITLSHIYN